MKIKNSDLLLEYFRTGICLFTGAGFSCLPNEDGVTLPTSESLAHDLIEKFSLDDIYEDDISYVTDQCPQPELDHYLRERFNVNKYNPLYKVLNNIKINTYVTTNIDGIFRNVIRDGDTYYINNMREYGAPNNRAHEIYYIPLHGDVQDLASKLYFSKTELVQVTLDNRNLFEAMYARLNKQPVVFLGYSFRDAGVMDVVTRLLKEGSHDIWIQCLPTDHKNIRFFGSKGCNIIEAETEEFLRWIQRQGNLLCQNQREDFDIDNLYQIPSLMDVTAVSAADYYKNGLTHWYPIITNVPYEREEVGIIYNKALSKKNIIIIGERFTGKTTILMQLALKVKSDRKFYLETPTQEEAELLCKKIKDNKAWIFIHNCTSNIDAFKVFAERPNTYVIGTSYEYQYETVRHLIDSELEYATVSVNDLSKEEALAIYNKLPKNIKKNEFTYKSNQYQGKYSMLEFIGLNVRNALTRQKIYLMLKQAQRENEQIFSIIAMTNYLSDNFSALSYSIVAAYFNIPLYPNAVDLVQSAKEYIKDFYPDNEIEEYYHLRSKLFAINARTIFMNEFRLQYSVIIEQFLKNVSVYKILHQNIFRRKAYDADLFYKLFSYEKANELFAYMMNEYEDCYVLQQWALCQMKFGHFKEAFSYIDKAIEMAPNNFSIQNSKAIILFEANKNDHSSAAIKSLKEAMAILWRCYSYDKRKMYHAIKFAEFAIHLKNCFSCDEFIAEAKLWVEDVFLEQGDNPTKKIKSLRKQLLAY